jgi:hypothetical protein
LNILIVTKINTIFLLIVLITGTFTSIFPSFIKVQAQNIEYYPPSEYEFNDGYQPKDSPPDIVVPIDFPTIQDAIKAADEGDVIKYYRVLTQNNSILLKV